MKLLELINKKKITQTELAKELGITRGLLSCWCCGRSVPTIKHIVPLARILGVSIKTIVMIFYKEVI